ncbi:15-hydroxyprostaglandin dehydrogenase [NAD(+)]-like [Zerene cesonia]|uniref:15-hydroxyprostaglandin dehydrogenase [NAD(+)]-like n=1 Tax=Zerene cesonia TaxID=33412 RepID=UPI0018E570DC|nr:15-hydroxyprostaglandin dehydrogenase [NAD(+)]-like [Zerene cesonia]
MDRDVKGKVVLITGSAEGLGLSMVENFLANGAKLAIMLDINEKQGLQSLERIKAKFGNDRAVFFKCNVTEDLDKVYQQVMGVTKNVDVVVNNAGVLAENDIKKTIDVNVTAVMEWTMKFLEHMRKDKGGNGGTIINVSSIYGFRITAHIPYYHASKFAVLGFTKSLGHEYTFKRTGVRVVTLCPGLTTTQLSQNPQVREEGTLNDFLEELKDTEWQEAKDIGRGTVEIFQKADSGTVWLVEGGRPAEKINV